MMRRTGIWHGVIRSGLFATFVAAAVLMAPASGARADGYRQSLKDYTAAILDAAEAAARVLADAKEHLDTAKALAEGARADVTAAGASASAALRAAAARAAAAVAAAEAGVAAATKALAVATAAAAAFLAGTGVGQGLGWCISWCWDPICDVDCACGEYHFATNAQIDTMIESLLLNGPGVALTRADYDLADTIVPGAGTASWEFLRSMVRSHVIAARGMAAYTRGDCVGHQHSRSNLESALLQTPDAISRFASVLMQLRTWEGTARADIANAHAELDQLQVLVPQFPDPAAMQQAINRCRAALNAMTVGLNMVSDWTGGPRPLDGPDGFIPPLTLERFHTFLAECANFGAAALPQSEVRMLDGLWAENGLSLRGQTSLGPAVAAWDGLGDLANESALFGPDGMLHASEVLMTSIPAFPGWANETLVRSPLVANCAGPYYTGFEPPLYFGSPSGIPLEGRDGWYVPFVAGSSSFSPWVLTDQFNFLGIPADPMGGGDQLIAGVGPGGGSNFVRAERGLGLTHELYTYWHDTYVAPSDQFPAGNNIGSFSLQPGTSAGFVLLFSWGDVNNPSTYRANYIVYTDTGVESPQPGRSPAPQWDSLIPGRWYRFFTTVNHQTNKIEAVGLTDLVTLEFVSLDLRGVPNDWFLRGGAAGGLPLPDAMRIFTGSATVSGNTTAWDHVAVVREPSRCPVISIDTTPIDVEPGAHVVLTAMVGGERPFHHIEWRRNGVALFDDERIRGSATTTLSIDPVAPDDTGFYELLVQNGCGMDMSPPIMISIRCAADFNGDGQVDFFDYLDFVLVYSNGDPGADFNRDGQVDFFDYLDFVIAYDGGC